MFACIYGGSVSKSATESPESQGELPLLDLAFTFSPLVEQTAADTVVLDISGQDLLFGSAKHPNPSNNHEEINSARNLAGEIARRARQLKLEVNVAVASNPDAAIHLARGCKGLTVVDRGEEGLKLRTFDIKTLNYSLAAVETHRAGEIQETFGLWGVRTFADLARLPQVGIAERLGQDGVRLQELARGKSKRNLNLVSPPVGFVQSLELEHAVTELEPLSFILSRLLNQLCANLREHALATNELRLSLKLPDKNEHERTITLPVPMQNSKTLLRLLLFEIEANPPSAPIVAVTISATPARPRASQTGLFIPLAPEPEKLEITLARLAKLVGAGNVGSPEPLDTHRPDSFRMNRFRIIDTRRKSANRQSAIGNRQCTMGFRVCRPPWRAEVQTADGRPVRISARAASAGQVRGRVMCAAGPWRVSGEWWRADVWARDEWDIAVSDPSSGGSEVLCRIYFDLTSDQWFVAGIYD
jgi:protein ImuB